MQAEYFEWAGCATGLAGAVLLALNIPASRYGWALFLASNCFLLTFAYLAGLQGLFVLQIGFSMTSIIGIYRSFRQDSKAISLSLSESRPSRIFAK